MVTRRHGPPEMRAAGQSIMMQCARRRWYALDWSMHQSRGGIGQSQCHSKRSGVEEEGSESRTLIEGVLGGRGGEIGVRHL